MIKSLQICACLFGIFLCFGFSDVKLVTFNGTVKNNGIPVKNVHVYVFEAGQIKSEIYTDSTGRFEVTSYFNKMLYIHVVKEGYIAQSIRANTRLFNKAQYNTQMNFDFKIIKQLKGKEPMKFKDPLGKIKYNYALNMFQFDTAYQAVITPKYEVFLKSLEEKDAGSEVDSTIVTPQ